MPPIIQGGMGVGVSGWRLARAVAQRGQLGVVSGTALDLLLTRQLQLGDLGGHLRRALEAFPYPEIAGRILERYFIPGGKAAEAPFKAQPMISHEPSRSTRELGIVVEFRGHPSGQGGPLGMGGAQSAGKNPDSHPDGALRCHACRRQRGADGRGHPAADSQNPRRHGRRPSRRDAARCDGRHGTGIHSPRSCGIRSGSRADPPAISGDRFFAGAGGKPAPQSLRQGRWVHRGGRNGRGAQRPSPRTDATHARRRTDLRRARPDRSREVCRDWAAVLVGRRLWPDRQTPGSAGIWSQRHSGRNRLRVL